MVGRLESAGGQGKSSLGDKDWRKEMSRITGGADSQK